MPSVIYCNLCNAEYSNHARLIEHQKDELAHNHPYRCHKCRRYFKSKEDSIKHMAEKICHKYSLVDADDEEDELTPGFEEAEDNTFDEDDDELTRGSVEDENNELPPAFEEDEDYIDVSDLDDQEPPPEAEEKVDDEE